MPVGGTLTVRQNRKHATRAGFSGTNPPRIAPQYTSAKSRVLRDTYLQVSVTNTSVVAVVYAVDELLEVLPC